MNNLKDKRIDFLDIAKGLLIISVVLCHSSFPNAHLLYWFHMPAFFIISGILHKKGISIKEQALKFFVPYFTFSAIDIFFNIGINNITFSNFGDQFIRYIYSGKATWGVFWFIPAIFLTKIIFDKLIRNFKTKHLIIILIIFYSLAHIYSLTIIPNEIPDITENYFVFWNIDVLLITIPYYAIGYYSKNIINILKPKTVLITSALASLIFLIWSSSGDISYYLNIKYSYYKSPLMDLVIPLTFTIFILWFSLFISKFKFSNFMKLLGANSLIIMYLHKPLAHLFDATFNHNYIIYTVIGVLLPLLIALLINLSSVSKFIFKGDLSLYKKYISSKDNLNNKITDYQV